MASSDMRILSLLIVLVAINPLRIRKMQESLFKACLVQKIVRMTTRRVDRQSKYTCQIFPNYDVNIVFKRDEIMVHNPLFGN